MPRYDTLMPIRTKGTAPPLFCVHGQPLKVAQRLNTNRPIYGLSHVYYSDFVKETPESIEQLASQYLSEIRQVQPEGPYHFCGFSAGGMIAFEMARQLRAAGQEVGSLVMVEPTVVNGPPTWADRIAGTVSQSDNLLAGIKQVMLRAPASIKARAGYYSKQLYAKVCLAIGKPLPESLRWLGYLKSLGPAMHKYEYAPVDCRGTLLYQMIDDEYVAIVRDHWSSMLLQGADIVVFPNAHKHEDFMLEPALSETVELIDRLGV